MTYTTLGKIKDLSNFTLASISEEITTEASKKIHERYHIPIFECVELFDKVMLEKTEKNKNLIILRLDRSMPVIEMKKEVRKHIYHGTSVILEETLKELRIDLEDDLKEIFIEGKIAYLFNKLF